jgi:hypothetical protein
MWTVTLLILVLAGFALPAAAVEQAPRISDREIIEALAELKTGQKSLQQQIDDFKQSTQQQFYDLWQDMDQRFKGMNQRFDDMNQRFDDMNQRFNDMNQRFNDVMTLLQILIGVLALVLGGLLAWLSAVWRRLVQVEERQKAFELQGDEIRFLRESHGRLEALFLQILERANAPR